MKKISAGVHVAEESILLSAALWENGSEVAEAFRQTIWTERGVIAKSLVNSGDPYPEERIGETFIVGATPITGFSALFTRPGEWGGCAVTGGDRDGVATPMFFEKTGWRVSLEIYHPQ